MDSAAKSAAALVLWSAIVVAALHFTWPAATGVTDALGRSLSSVLDGATGYEVADGRLLVDLDKTAAEGTSTCLIATTARDGVGADVPISLRFTDETVACD